MFKNNIKTDISLNIINQSPGDLTGFYTAPGLEDYMGSIDLGVVQFHKGVPDSLLNCPALYNIQVYSGSIDNTYEYIRCAVESIPLVARRQIRTKNWILLFSYVFEGDIFFIDQVDSILKSHDWIDNSTVCYTGGAIVSKDHNYNGTYVPCPFHLARVKHTFRTEVNYNTYEYQDRKAFVCLNNRPRHHRVILTALLKQRNLIDYGFISYSTNDMRLTDIIWNYSSVIQDDCHLIEYIKTDTSERIIDNPTNSMDFANDSYTPWLYDCAEFGVVTETLFTGDAPFLTEKIYKPIAAKKPMIVVGSHGTLRALQDQGFETYSPYIDESYDAIENDTDRMLAIVDEIERLCNLSNSEWVSFHRNLNDAYDTNYIQLFKWSCKSQRQYMQHLSNLLHAKIQHV